LKVFSVGVNEADEHEQDAGQADTGSENGDDGVLWLDGDWTLLADEDLESCITVRAGEIKLWPTQRLAVFLTAVRWSSTLVVSLVATGRD
jgi:hypothetical protein